MVIEQVSEDLSTGLKATEEPDAKPFGHRVVWIAWDSGFRGSGLEIGDRILAVDGEPLDPASLEIKRSQYVGSSGEYNRWKARGAREGQLVTLSVKRRAQRLEVRGALRAKRWWRAVAAGPPLLSPHGPESNTSDGFIGGWGSWYDKLVETLSITLDSRWRHRIDNRARLRDLLEQKPRVDALVSRWPGPFAEVLAADFAAAATCLEGRTYEVTAADLAYRDLGPARAAEIRAAAKLARDTFLAAHAAETIPPFPTADASSVDAREKVAGKIVVLPPFRRGSQWVEGRRNWMVAGDDRQGHYFVDVRSEPMERMYEAEWRYMKLIDPKSKNVYEVIGRIGADPKMVVREGRAVIGLGVEPLAVTMNEGALFVDLTRRDGESSLYAGEPVAPPLVAPSPELSPAALMELFFDALQRGDRETWQACFATWELRVYASSRPVYAAQSPPFVPAMEREWVRAREVALGAVYDVRVVEVSEVEVVLTPDHFPGAPTIEQVVVEVDHVGLFDGVYRAFSNSKTHRLWPLQRRDGGPWRIAVTDQGI